MELKKNDVSNNAKEGKEYKQYKRKVYHCENDDAWINVEIPATLLKDIV